MALSETFTSVVEVMLERTQQRWWSCEGDALQKTLVDHYGADLAGHELTPPQNPDALRSKLRTVAPSLAALTERVRHAFDVDEACAVLIPRLGLGEVDLDQKRKGVFAFATLIGEPTANLPFDEVFWDVQNQGEMSSRHTSFSENDREADYHADNGSLRIPERFFLLYSVHAASCGGGMSMIRDGRILRERLETTAQGRAAVQQLERAIVPRRVPKAFRRYAEVADDGYKYTPILTPQAPPMWRWRKDKIYQGLAKRPRYATEEVVRAVDMVADELANGTDQLRAVVPTDGVIVINNHLALHGRTAFTDPDRHLLRLRFHEPSKYNAGVR